mgnify:CR=1 FL=1
MLDMNKIECNHGYIELQRPAIVTQGKYAGKIKWKCVYCRIDVNLGPDPPSPKHDFEKCSCNCDDCSNAFR